MPHFFTYVNHMAE
jgi:hypothetical protein